MRYFFSIVLGLAMLFPALAGAISSDKSSYVMDQVADETIFIPNVSGIGGRFYNLTVPDFAMTVNGWSEMYELPSDFLIPGDYIVVDTNDPDVCSTLALDECRANPDYIGETAFSVGVNSSSAEAPVQENSFLGGLGELLGF